MLVDRCPPPLPLPPPESKPVGCHPKRPYADGDPLRSGSTSSGRSSACPAKTGSSCAVCTCRVCVM
jgi:hypothetical protein